MVYGYDKEEGSIIEAQRLKERGIIMERKKKDITILKDNVKFQIFVCILLSFIIILLYYTINNIIDLKKSREFNIVYDSMLVNNIENLSVESGKIKLTGYAFLLDRDSSENKISVFLRNVAKKQNIWLDMTQTDRIDVNEYYDGEFNYENSGFIGTISDKKLQSNEVYEIIINIDYEVTYNNLVTKKARKTVSTNKYIFNNKLYSYNPNEFIAPDLNIESSMLKEVFTNGDLCFYDHGMYVYLYKDKIYWITSDDLSLNSENPAYVIFHLYTSQAHLLPEQRKPYRFENFDFYFEKFEYKNEITAPYRVAIRELPKDYVIATIKTGLYDIVNKTELWYKDIYINYSLN